jgi:hypothetical protein
MAFSTFNSFTSLVHKTKINALLSSLKNPTSISGLQLWLDATDNSSLVLSGSSLSQWNDKSGHGRNATKYGSSSTNAVYNATGFNNLPAIQMNTGQGLSVPMPTGTIVSGISVLVIFQKNGAINQYETIVSRQRDDGSNYCAPIDTYDTVRTQGGNNYITATFNIKTATSLNLFSFTVAPNLWDEYVNGSSVFNANITPSFDDVGSNFFHIGTRPGNLTNFTGVISEVIVYNKVLTATERQFNEGYLAWKYNINNQLPNTHPYYNNKPL